jgi:inosine-uridine nucleoside N-ribohydrolase
MESFMIDIRFPQLLAGLCFLSLFSFPASRASAPAPGSARTPVILDTDIGDDIDDTWALCFLLRSPELDLKLVVTDYGNTEYRARIVARLLQIAGRTDVPVGIGVKQNDSMGKQGPWVKDYDLSRYPGRVHRDGVQALIDTIMSSPQPITLLCIGPPPNLKAALEREPRIARRAKIVGMYGSVRRGYDGKQQPDAEWNVKASVEASRRLLSAPWEITLTPLDTCGLVRLKGEKYAAVRNSKDPLIRALIENYRIWSAQEPARSNDASSVLFDTAAVYLALSRKLVVMERLGLRVTDDGFTVVDPKAKAIDCAVEWRDLPAFEDFLVGRLTGR